MTFEHMLERITHRRKDRRIDGGLGVRRCEPCRRQERIALAQSELQRVGKADDHVPPRHRSFLHQLGQLRLVKEMLA
jgi:hypothetical protein